MKRMYAVSEYLISKHIPERFADNLVKIDSNIAYKYDNTISVSDLAKAQCEGTFDTALPNDWVHEFQRQTGFNPVGHIVIDYSKNSLGIPKPITIEGKVAYKIFLHVNNIDFG